MIITRPLTPIDKIASLPYMPIALIFLKVIKQKIWMPHLAKQYIVKKSFVAIKN